MPPPPIVDRIGAISPRPVLLIYADPGIGGESARQPEYFAAAGDPKAIWEVPGAGHTGGIDAEPAEYERRVLSFFDAALLGAQPVCPKGTRNEPTLRPRGGNGKEQSVAPPDPNAPTAPDSHHLSRSPDSRCSIRTRTTPHRR